jgi:predicted metal-dependent HD superfamily phosphohydrolase
VDHGRGVPHRRGSGVTARGALIRWWKSTWSDLGLRRPEANVLAELLARYAEPHRAYHTAHHLEECAVQFEPARGLAVDPGAVQLALWFHDAIYDTGRSDNEDESAAWAVRVLADAGASVPRQDAVREMILATKHDAMPRSSDAALTVDVDLSILAAPTARFDEYEVQIRREYASVPEHEFRTARAAILREFLARPRIYATDPFRDRLEAPARANLQRSLARLFA